MKMGSSSKYKVCEQAYLRKLFDIQGAREPSHTYKQPIHFNTGSFNTIECSLLNVVSGPAEGPAVAGPLCGCTAMVRAAVTFCFLRSREFEPLLLSGSVPLRFPDISKPEDSD
jgi:hypothetical protein